ncbi:MAG: pilus (MSHA type) biogenesis protein MshL [Sterolibacteriaceae bacterium]|nr:pilus (MSHA type) biogenesis protein MshL [Sterolibacteriaceae bacterium]
MTNQSIRVSPGHLIGLLVLLAGCTTAPTLGPSNKHIGTEPAKPAAPVATIPQPVDIPAALPRPKAVPRLDTYSVVVNNVKVQELLFALARDAKINVDVHPGLDGTITLNAIDQTLPQLLSRIARQVDMRYEIDGPNLIVMPDSPFLRTYRVDYVNLSRDTTGAVSINTQITSGGSGSSSSGSGNVGISALGGSNNSTTEVRNTGKNRFWETLEKNIKDILRETDKILPEGSSETVIENEDLQTTTGSGAQTGSKTTRRQSAPASLAGSPSAATLQTTGTQIVRRTTFREAASVIVNPESGIVTVRATARQHEKVQEFIDLVMTSAKRQVLIEATIAEVTLGTGYQQGIDWSRLRPDGSGFGVSPAQLGANPTSNITPFVLNYSTAGKTLNVLSTINLLERFGTVKVLSSPKLSVLNNQTALLKVVDNIVYFEVKADTTTTANVGTTTAFTTTPRSVSVGLVMSVTPQISENDNIVLNVRPTISRVTALARDPNPSIPANIPNNVPQIQTRELESVLRVSNGDIAVLGGLMEDRVDYKTGRVPILGAVPLLGEALTSRDNAVQKTELVIFLRPIVIRDASLEGDYRSYRDRLPTADYFRDNPNPPLPQWELGTR